MTDEIDPRRRHTYFLTDDERTVTPGGPALVGPDGQRLEVPAKVYDALRHVAQAMYDGLGVTVDPAEPLLSVGEASDVIRMPVAALREYIEDGTLPVQDKDGAWHIALPDLLAFDDWFRRRRREVLSEMAQNAQDWGLDEATNRIPPPMR